MGIPALLTFAGTTLITGLGLVVLLRVGPGMLLSPVWRILRQLLNHEGVPGPVSPFFQWLIGPGREAS